MDFANKTAKLIQKDGKKWLIGGTWSAGGRFPKRMNWRKVADEEGFSPRDTSNIWLRDEQQVGWFSFHGHKVAGYPLAPTVLQQVKIKELPWRGLFKLDGGWWFIAVDDQGAIHPRWDVWIEDGAIDTFLTRHASEISSFKYDNRFDTPEESWAWLLDGGVKPGKTVRPILVDSKYQSITIAACVVSFMTAVLGYHLVEEHRKEVMAKNIARERDLAMEKKQQYLNAQKAKINAQKAFDKKLKAYWANYQRPFLSYPSWHRIISDCSKSLAVGYHLSEKTGWVLKSVSCRISGTGNPTVNKWSLSEKTTWDRGNFANIFHRPPGAISQNGNIIMESTSVGISENPGKPLTGGVENNLHWIGESQKWERVIKITHSPMNSFVPPPPTFLTPQEKKDYKGPILWHSESVFLSSSVNPSHGWDALKYNNFVPNVATASVMNNQIAWTFVGTQYAQ